MYYKVQEEEEEEEDECLSDDVFCRPDFSSWSVFWPFFLSFLSLLSSLLTFIGHISSSTAFFSGSK